MEIAEFQTNWLNERLRLHGDKPFLHFGDRTHTYSELRLEIELQRNRLTRARVSAGEVVALLSDYSFSAIALFLALYEFRTVVVPITSTVRIEIEERLGLLCIDRIIRDPSANAPVEAGGGAELHEILRRLQEARRSGLVLFSSGSTGKPKAMVHDLDRLVDSYSARKSRDLTMMVVLMFDHIGGLNTLLTALASGATLVIPESRDPERVAELVARHRVAILPASPTFLNLLLLSGAPERFDLSSLKFITYGTEPMPESLLGRLRLAFPRTRFLQTFGTSETGISQTTSLSSSSTLLRLDDPNIEHRVVNGELWLRSRTQILGYLNHSMESFTTDGWFKTGDLVETAENGYLRIRGRVKEIINVGGQKVLPAEIESVLLEMPEIEDCVVFGELNPITGQVVCAKVILKHGISSGPIRQAVRTFCRGRLDSYKIPVKVAVSDVPLFGARFKKQRIVSF
jgi:acyl-CoA synthetase (AMP-forming)/AMP-acid ligase II